MGGMRKYVLIIEKVVLIFHNNDMFYRMPARVETVQDLYDGECCNFRLLNLLKESK